LTFFNLTFPLNLRLSSYEITWLSGIFSRVFEIITVPIIADPVRRTLQKILKKYEQIKRRLLNVVILDQISTHQNVFEVASWWKPLAVWRPQGFKYTAATTSSGRHLANIYYVPIVWPSYLANIFFFEIYLSPCIDELLRKVLVRNL
jgi:hypothetical protein